MMHFLMLFALANCCVCRALSFAKFVSIPPTTVETINATAYMGRWFEMYTSLIPSTTFEKDGYCVTADYNNLSANDSMITFRVTNSMRTGKPDGELEQAMGTATNDNPKEDPGKFSLVFDNMPTPVPGSYWIVKVGDIPEGEDKYPWAIVSAPFQVMLWILARDVDSFKEKYEQELLNVVEELGFTYFFNKPIKTFQSSSECQYAPMPE